MHQRESVTGCKRSQQKTGEMRLCGQSAMPAGGNSGPIQPRYRLSKR